MIVQHLALDYDFGVLICPGCQAQLAENRLEHPDDCPEVASLAAAAVEAGRDRASLLRAVIQRVLNDEESRPGGWGTDITAVGWLREAMEATK